MSLRPRARLPRLGRAIRLCAVALGLATGCATRSRDALATSSSWVGGCVINHSSETLWVAAEGLARQLAPGRASPVGVDADGVKRLSGAIAGHAAWWKIPNGALLEVVDGPDGQPALRGLVYWRVAEQSFGRRLRYVPDAGWGRVLD